MVRRFISKIKLASPRRTLVVLVGLILVSVGMFVLIKRFILTTGPATIPTETATSTNDPEEKKPTDDQFANYTVPADQPRSIRIDSIGVHGLLQRVGVDSNNAIAVPTNINFGGWYVGSKLPGSKGLSIIDGHVQGRYNDAIFKNLHNSKVDTVVEIEFGDKSIKKFRVVEVKTLPEAESTSFLFLHNPDIASQLNLITCAGKFDESTDKYPDRVIVTTKLVNE